MLKHIRWWWLDLTPGAREALYVVGWIFTWLTLAILLIPWLIYLIGLYLTWAFELMDI